MTVKVFGGGGPGGAAHALVTCLSSDVKPAGDICYGIGLLIELDTNKFYRWFDEWIEIPVGGSSAWGDITGTLSDQTDLQSAFNGKSAAGHNHDSAYATTGHHHDADYAAVVHTHSASEISDSTAVGRSVVTAADQAAARDAIGAAAAGEGGGAAWGGITGTLADQTDLQTALDAKASSSHNHDSAYEPKNANIQAHVAAAHAPSDAQKNSDITKAEIEAKLTGEITSHTHAGGGGALSYLEADRATDLALSTTYTAAASLNLGAGTWLVIGQTSIESTSTTQGNVSVRLRNTTDGITYSIAEGEVDSALPDRCSLFVHAMVVLAGTKAVALEGRQSAGTSHMIGPGNLADTETKVTRLTALKIA